MNRAKAAESRLSSQIRALNIRDEQNNQKLEDVEAKLRTAEKKVAINEIALENVSKEANAEVEKEIALAEILFEARKQNTPADAEESPDEEEEGEQEDEETSTETTKTLGEQSTDASDASDIDSAGFTIQLFAFQSDKTGAVSFEEVQIKHAEPDSYQVYDAWSLQNYASGYLRVKHILPVKPNYVYKVQDTNIQDYGAVTFAAFNDLKPWIKAAPAVVGATGENRIPVVQVYVFEAEEEALAMRELFA
jgi:hypothetical protein